MYLFEITADTFFQLRQNSIKSPSILNKIEVLSETPLSGAIQTGIETIGDYYVNAGRWCILFNIDEQNQTVQLLRIMHSAKLYKILQGLIPPD